MFRGEYLQKLNCLIFDLDGTLADSYNVFLKAFKIVAEEFNLKTADLSSEHLKNLGTREILNELGVSLIQLPFITKRGREEMWKLREELYLFNDVEETLNTFIKEGVHLAILTSNSSELVHYLIPESIAEHIDILKPSALFGKAGAIKKYCKEKKFIKAEVGYVGDETRDIEAANDAEVNSIAVSYGFNSKIALQKYSPTLIIDDFKSLLKLTK